MGMGMRTMGSMAARGGTNITSISHANPGRGRYDAEMRAWKEERAEDEKVDMTVGATH